MNKAGKHIQTGVNNVLLSSSPKSPLLQNNLSNSNMGSMAQKNVITSIMSFLPDNRPITSLQIVEDYEK